MKGIKFLILSLTVLIMLCSGCAGQFHTEINPDEIIVDIRFNELEELEGTTNLPNGTILGLEIAHQSGWSQKQIVTVQDGHFRTPPIQRTMQSLPDGRHGEQAEIAQIESPAGLYIISWQIITQPRCVVVKP